MPIAGSEAVEGACVAALCAVDDKHVGLNMPLDLPLLSELRKLRRRALVDHVDNFQQLARDDAKTANKGWLEEHTTVGFFGMTHRLAGRLSHRFIKEFVQLFVAGNGRGRELQMQITVRQVEVAVMTRVAQDADDDLHEGAASVVEGGR